MKEKTQKESIMPKSSDMDGKQDLEQIMDAYGNAILRMCYIYLKDYQLAEDITQETFIRVYQHYHEFNGKSSLKTWITQIAINLCKNEMRTKWWKNRENAEVTEILEGDASYDDHLDSQLIVSEIAKLPQKYREVILLFYYQEFSIQEIAEILGERKTTVKTRLSRARAMLKPGLKEELCYE